MSIMQKALTLNSQGVFLLEQGNAGQASKAFQESLQIFKQAVSFIETLENVAKTDSSPSQTFVQSPNIVPGLESSSGFIYNHAIIIDHIPQTLGEIDILLPLYSAIVLFNLGLAYHRDAKLGRESAFQRTIMLYRMALKLLDNFEAKNTDISAIALLVLNNQAQAHYESCDYQHSGICMAKVSSLIYNADGFKQVFQEDVMEGLILNVMLHDAPTAARAA